MKIVKKIKIFSIIFLLWGGAVFSKEININVVGKKTFDIVANVGDFAITKYDLTNLIKIYNINGNVKYTNKVYNEVLDSYIDILVKRIIASKDGMDARKIDRQMLWKTFSSSLNVDKYETIDSFCKKNNVDRGVLLFILESNFLWLKYVENKIKSEIKVSDDNIKDVIEYMNLGNKIIKYNLSEIVLYYKDQEEKVVISKKIKEIYKKLNDKNFSTMAFSMSNSNSAKNNGLIGWIYEKELNSEVINIVKKLTVGSFSEPVCLGDEVGSCFIFKVNDRDVVEEHTNEIENDVRAFIFNQKLETTVRNIVNYNRQKININYK